MHSELDIEFNYFFAYVRPTFPLRRVVILYFDWQEKNNNANLNVPKLKTFCKLISR
jgi:hypothetical protein